MMQAILLFAAETALAAWAISVLVRAVLRHIRKVRDKWQQTPTLEQYVAAHPQCKTARGIKCVHCNSNSIRSWGVAGPADEMRYFLCNHCGSYLYRSDG
ncbi:MAG: hypothetical protein ACYC9L_02890 [Sulfuricaulis sp.]